MSDNKKYYYFRLTENFFDSESMILLESQKDGYLYSNILLKLYAKSLKCDGRLMFNDFIPYNAEMISKIVRHNKKTVEKALEIFQKFGLIEILDNGAIYMVDIQNYIGKSGTESDRKREYRKRIEAEKEGQMSGQSCNKSNEKEGQMSGQCPREKEIEIESEKELKIESEQKSKTEKEFHTDSEESVSYTLSQNAKDAVIKQTDTISFFKKRYEERTGKQHPAIPFRELAKTSQTLEEFGANKSFVNSYFGDNLHKGLCGDSDCNIKHFASPGVLDILSRRCTTDGR